MAQDVSQNGENLSSASTKNEALSGVILNWRKILITRTDYQVGPEEKSEFTLARLLVPQRLNGIKS